LELFSLEDFVTNSFLGTEVVTPGFQGKTICRGAKNLISQFEHRHDLGPDVCGCSFSTHCGRQERPGSLNPGPKEDKSIAAIRGRFSLHVSSVVWELEECRLSACCFLYFLGFPGVNGESWIDQGDGWCVPSLLVFSSYTSGRARSNPKLGCWVRLRS